MCYTIACNTQPCAVPVDCAVGSWSSYNNYDDYYNVMHDFDDIEKVCDRNQYYGSSTSCSKSCGGGVRFEYRQVTHRQAKGGQSCPALSHTIACNTQPCAVPVDCAVGSWSSYNNYDDYYNVMHDFDDNEKVCERKQYYGSSTSCSKTCGGVLIK